MSNSSFKIYKLCSIFCTKPSITLSKKSFSNTSQRRVNKVNLSVIDLKI